MSQSRVLWRFLFAIPCLSLSAVGLASGGGGRAEFINFYAMLLHAIGFGGHGEHATEIIHKWQALPGSLLVLCLLVLGGLGFRAHCKKMCAEDVSPPQYFSLNAFFEMLMDFVINLAESLIGKAYKPFLPLMAGLFLFIFVSNLSGLVPGFPPATESLSTNLAMGFSVFLIYNYHGLKEHGASYAKQFMGPIWWMIPLILLIELIAHAARPLSLSLRLYGNIFGDHLVLSVFAGLTKGIFVVPLLFFGLLVASIQSFVFTLLSGIYISLAISHDH